MVLRNQRSLRVMPTTTQLLERFALLHTKLNGLKKIADDTWHQGGMAWSVELLHRGASTATIDETSVSKLDDAFSDTQFDKNLGHWAEFVWSARGQKGDFENIFDDDAWAIEKARCVKLCMQEARELFEPFRPNGKHERSAMMAEIDDISIHLKIILTSGRHAILHTAVCSVD